jgi:hypothetical protein
VSHTSTHTHCSLYSHPSPHCSLYSHPSPHRSLYSHPSPHCSLYSHPSPHCSLYSHPSPHRSLYSQRSLTLFTLHPSCHPSPLPLVSTVRVASRRSTVQRGGRTRPWDPRGRGGAAPTPQSNRSLRGRMGWLLEAQRADHVYGRGSHGPRGYSHERGRVETAKFTPPVRHAMFW